MISYKKAEREDLSKYLTICIDFNCNNNCISCMLKDIKKKMKPVSFKNFKKIINKNIKSKKYSSLIISGAEVTTNKDLKQFIEYAKKFGNFKNIRIQTNGKKLSEYEYSKELINSGVNEFFVSIYGSNNLIHENITQTKDSFDSTFKGIKNLDKLGALIITNTVITKLNYRDLPNIVNKLSKFRNIVEMQFWNYWSMNQVDSYKLLESVKEIKKYILNVIEKGDKNGTYITVKNFPECLLGQYSNHLDNSQPDTIIDKLYWEKFKLNSFNLCLYNGICLSKKCIGFSKSYIDQFGWEEDILSPILQKKNILGDNI